jgi:hypothetical protein
VEVFLLALRIECPSQPNMDYVTKLKDYYDHDISPATILVWFPECLDYAGTFKVPKFSYNQQMDDEECATRVMTYRTIMAMFSDHSKWIVLDEKHIVNCNILPKKGTSTHSLVTIM